jgi:hypothetical protein
MIEVEIVGVDKLEELQRRIAAWLAPTVRRVEELQARLHSMRMGGR